MNNLLIVDGMALLFRHFFATSLHKNYMKNSQGIPTNGVQGFVRHIVSAIHDTDAHHVIVCWDMGAKTFRNEIDPNYKAHRPAPQDELIPQFDMVQEISRQLGFHNIGIQNFEADDVIGTLAHALDNTYDIKVISGDRDLLQILDEHIEVWLTKKGFNIYNKYDKARFIEEYQIEPKQLIDVKAFMGDTADGYPGVKGIGEKTALKLIQTYRSVDGVLEHIEELSKGQQNKINEGVEALRLSHQLAAIHTEVPLKLDEIISEMPYSVDLASMIDICNQYELKVAKNFIAKL
ncbi:5'-3' exonuclease [Macrococcoides bohemicum]|uniref:5'-3' exonuclease n=1 Tax=Macrococcoides bohemicum TaxID=1903056 RepID=A0AAE7Q9M3_9STAP|nr:5'-3' exonuclease [Macrococcus bohemicus]QRN49924.1 5'-3' exonuclease [Macrococcus bohemicus]QYA41390.1 5'-3' exonuclease [Macrococcus bohemicus]QYA43814.1 5'-3' exonuclease [Macrococcus bohemicus]